MIRRSFFQLLTGFAIPLPRWHLESSESAAKLAASLIPKLASPVPSKDLPDPKWLQEWMRLPRSPVISADLPQIADPQERERAALILQRIRSGSPLDFHYSGGSEPRKLRQVLPVLLFTTALDDMPCGGHPESALPPRLVPAPQRATHLPLGQDFH